MNSALMQTIEADRFDLAHGWNIAGENWDAMIDELVLEQAK